MRDGLKGFSPLSTWGSCTDRCYVRAEGFLHGLQPAGVSFSDAGLSRQLRSLAYLSNGIGLPMQVCQRDSKLIVIRGFLIIQLNRALKRNRGCRIVPDV